MSEGKNVTKAKSKLDNIGVVKDEIIFFEPDEFYKAEFESAEVKPGKYGDFALMKFKVLDGKLENGEDAAGKTVFGFLNIPVKLGSDGAKIVEVMQGAPVEEGKAINLTSYYGKRYKIFIEDQKKKKGNEGAPRKQSVTKIKKIEKKVEKTDE